MSTKKNPSGNIQRTCEAEPFLIALSESVDIADIGGLQQRLEHALKVEPSTLVLDGGQVSRIDGASLQLLAMFYREARTQGYTIEWKNPSAVLQHAAGFLGLTQWLGLNASKPTAVQPKKSTPKRGKA